MNGIILLVIILLLVMFLTLLITRQWGGLLLFLLALYLMFRSPGDHTGSPGCCPTKTALSLVFAKQIEFPGE